MSMSVPERASRAVGQVAAVGSLPSDTPDERLRKSALVLSSLLITILSFIWVGTYAALGLWRSALIPLAYQVASLVGLALFAKTKRYAPYRASQVAMFLVLPFLLQWSLGGFVDSGAVALWAFVAPLGALVFYGPREAIGWVGAFLALVAFSAAIDGILPEPSEDIAVLLDEIFSAFDELVARQGLEKIKTIGDGYLVAAGIPTPRADHAEAAARLALAMQRALADLPAATGLS